MRYYLFFLLLCFLGSTTEIKGEGMMAGYGGGSSDNRSETLFSVLEVFLTDFWDFIKGLLVF